MRPFSHFFKKLWILFRRETFNSGLEEEMAFHREQLCWLPRRWLPATSLLAALRL